MDTRPLVDAPAPAVPPFDLCRGHEALSADAQLLAASAQGLDALAPLYDRYRAMAYSSALRITNDSALAEDVVQEAFLDVWRNADRYQAGRGSVTTWVLAIVHHRAIDVVRRRRPVTQLSLFEIAPPTQLQAPDVWAEVCSDLDAVEVQRVMAALSAVQRQAIEFAYFGGLTQQEIAQRIGAPLGTVKSRIRLGLLAMRATLIAEQVGMSTLDPATTDSTTGMPIGGQDLNAASRGVSAYIGTVDRTSRSPGDGYG